MKKFLFLSMISFCGLTGGQLAAQALPEPRILLDDYTYTAADLLVGSLHVLPSPGAPPAAFELKGGNAEKFKLKGTKLYIRKKYAKNAERWYDIEVATAGGANQASFRIVKDAFHRNSVIAHRGAWKNTGVPENTVASFMEAVKLGCQGSEFDVHMSADSVLVLFHDREMNGHHVEKTEYARLAAMKLSNGESLPELGDFIEAATQQNTTRLVFEIKPSAISKERSIALAERSVAAVHKAKAQGWVDYISFDYDILKRVKELDPFAKVAYLNGEKAPAELADADFYGLDYNQKVYRAKPEWIEESQKLGLTLNVWTVNDGEGMDWFLERDFDFITTDEPELLLEKVKVR